jgi:hypothetical protein
MASDLDNIISRLDKAFFATDLTSKGSNLAESSSLATVRATLIPSWYPGGARTPPENACAIVSFNLLEDLERYSASKLERARRISTVSGLNGTNLNGYISGKERNLTFDWFGCIWYQYTLQFWRKNREGAARALGIQR